jgi:NADH:ubiquinone oxidoreductase subunit 6 (subunit J)
MLLNLRVEGVPRLGDLQMRGLVGVGVAGLVGLGVMIGLEAAAGTALEAVPAAYGTIETVGTAIFSGRFLLPFEVASALLTVAMIGAVILAKREI